MAETKRARGAAARLAGLESPRRNFAGNSSELDNPAFPGSNRSKLGSGMLLTPCVIHWRQKKEAVRAQSRDRDGDGGPGRRNLAGVRRAGQKGVLRPTESSAKETGCLEGAHRGLEGVDAAG